MNQNEILNIVAVCLFAIAIIIGIVYRIRTEGLKKVTKDIATVAADSKIKEIADTVIKETLIKAGFTDTYEAFENSIALMALDKIKEVLSNGKVVPKDAVDAISDDAILDCIYKVIDVSGVRDDIKKAYDDLIAKRLKEMEQEDERVEEENKQLEEGSFPEVDDEYGMPALDAESVTKQDVAAHDNEPDEQAEPENVDVFEVVK